MDRSKIFNNWPVYRALCWFVLGLWLTIVPTILSTEAASVTSVDQIQTQETFLAAEKASLLEQGRRQYQSARFSEAIALWQQAAQTYETQGHLVNQALSLSYLASAYKELGQWQAAESAISESLVLLQGTSSNSYVQVSSSAVPVLAQAWNTQGSLQLAAGNPEAALSSWQQAEALYEEIDDFEGRIGSQLNQAQALQSLGLHRRTRTQLEGINQELQSQPNAELKAKTLQNLGVILQNVGAFSASLSVLERSLSIAQQIDTGANTSAVLLALGRTWQGLSDISQALSFYEQAAAIATTPLDQVNAQLNQLSLLIATDQRLAAQARLPKLQTQLPTLPASRLAVYARVNFAQSWMQLSPKTNSLEIVQILSKAVEQAQQLNDVRAESYALGQIGRLYEQNEQWSEAQALTERALDLVRGRKAAEIAYRWQWQLGRIFCKGEVACTPAGNRVEAIAAYTAAVEQLKALRTNLVANSQVQFSFQEQVEPVYRELTTLLLTPAPNQADISQDHLKQARTVIESLQLAELDNFFQSACLDIQPKQIDQIDPTAAVMYPILLPDRLAVILALHEQPLQYYETTAPQAELQRELRQMRESLSLAFPTDRRLQIAQKVYDWLIRPAETALEAQHIQTLVLVPDGLLRNVSFAALYDGHQYLIEKYSVALSSSLQLVEARSLDPEHLDTLLGGLTESRQGFSALPAANIEVEKIAAQVPTERLINRNFTKANLKTQINRSTASIIHLATHGQFSSQQEETFILAWDGKITVADFSELLTSRRLRADDPISLLVLSACQTATGDNRAGLGLAGLAVRSGALSTLASLWSVDDHSTAELMVNFYDALTQPNMTKTEALRQAQLAILHQENYQHPFFWAAFVIVGNWL